MIRAGLDDDESMYNVNAGGSGAGGSGGLAGQMMGADGTWPSMQDLNTRLRRVITSYQRNYKKEELKQQQKAKVRITSASTYFSLHIPHTHPASTSSFLHWHRVRSYR